jgi:hypothetical protein
VPACFFVLKGDNKMSSSLVSRLAIAVPASLLIVCGALAQTASTEAGAAASGTELPETGGQAAGSTGESAAQETQKVQQISSLEDEMIGGIDWEANIVYGVGDGVPPTNAINAAQARVRAKRAAMDEAMARLLEMVQEVRVDAESTTRDFVNESRAVNTAVSGLVRNAEVEEIRQFDDGSYQIKMRMPIHDQKGLSRTLLPSMLNQVQKVSIVTRSSRSGSMPAQQEQAATVPMTSEAQPAGGSATYTSLIVDATEIGASPAMYPSIFSASGDVLYDISVPDPNVSVMDGVAAYRTSLEKAKKDERAGANPLIVTAAETAGSGKSNLVIDDADAGKVASLGGEVLREAKVIIVTR